MRPALPAGFVIFAAGVGTAVLLRKRLTPWLTGARRRQARPGPRIDAGIGADRLVSVGRVDHRSVRIWLRSDAPGPHTVALRLPDGTVDTRGFDVPAGPELDGTTVVRWPEDFAADDLLPHTTYTFGVARDGVAVGAGRFTTAPKSAEDAPDCFSIAVASCHQPFAADGQLSPAALRLLDGLEAAFDAEGVEQLLLMGDQMYTDLPSAHSVFDPAHFATIAPPGRARALDCSRDEVRALLQRRYRAFFAPAAFQRLQARWSTLCMLDDHEVCDNFGSAPAHARPEWAAWREGALDAFGDYQALRWHDRWPARKSAFPTRFARGPVAGLVLDNRSERVADDDRIRVFGEGQWRALDAFLREEADRPVILIGLGVPLAHEPEWLIDAAAPVSPAGGAAADRWSHPKVAADRDRLVEMLHAQRLRRPDQRVVLVSGDVHVGTVAELRWSDAPPVLQLVSSGISNLEAAAIRVGSAALSRVAAHLDTPDGPSAEITLLDGVDGRDQNPYTHLNAGLVTVRREGAGWQVRLRLLGHDDDDPPHARVVFDSGWR